MFFPADLLLLAISVNTGHYVHGINACIPPYILFVNCAYLCSTPMRTYAVCPFISITDNVQNNLVTLQRHDFLVISNSNFNRGKLDSVVLAWSLSQRSKPMCTCNPSIIMAWLDTISTSIWAVTRQNQQNDCAPSEDSDQPGHLPSLISLRSPHEESLGP